MLISAILGVIDDETGLMYYINAEHPWVALYRDKTASFIENELSLRKIGIEGLAGKLQIKLFNLQDGDVLFCGSDGRDDIVFGEQDEADFRVINEDETIFLKRIEEAGGKLLETKQGIEDSGKLVDDLSLLRIEFHANKKESTVDKASASENITNAIKKEDAGAALEIFLTNLENGIFDSEVARNLYNLIFRKKDFESAILLCDKYLDKNPVDTEFLYFASYVCKFLYAEKKDVVLLSKAIDYGERFRLRNYSSMKNLLNLSDIYRLRGNYERAEKIALQAKALEPDNKQVVRVLDMIETKKKGVE